MEEKRAEVPLGLVRALHKVTIQDHSVEEALCQILGLFVFIALSSQIAVDRLPIPLDQQADQGLVPCVSSLDIPDQGPMGGEKGLAQPPDVRPAIIAHRSYLREPDRCPSKAFLASENAMMLGHLVSLYLLILSVSSAYGRKEA
jgi:hypothetical protein